jgi:hypothetical protein
MWVVKKDMISSCVLVVVCGMPYVKQHDYNHHLSSNYTLQTLAKNIVTYH